MRENNQNSSERERGLGREDIEPLTTALQELANSRDEVLAATLTRFFTAVASEASKGPRFANALARALHGPSNPLPSSTRQRRANRRNPGPFDPFEVYADRKAAGLREALGSLELEQLRDIVAEHGMDNDRLAMKWKDPARVIDRIVDRVTTRVAKGSAFK